MSDWMLCLLVGLIPISAFCSGYNFGKAAGIKEGKHLMDEQWKIHESFRDTVFSLLGIEVRDERD